MISKIENTYLKICFFFNFILNFNLNIHIFKNKNKKFDVVQIHSNFLFLKNSKFLNLSVLCLKLLAKKSILDIKDLSSYPKKDIGFDYYFVNSQNTFNKIKKYIPKKKIRLIYSPLIIDKKNKTKKIKKNKFKILYLGSLNKKKGVEILINSMNYVLKSYPMAKLYLFGELLDNFAFKKRVFYGGPITHNQAMKKILESELLVLPSFSESLPRVIIEAMYLNTKILVSKGVPELERSLKNENLLKGFSKKEISMKIINQLSLYKFKKYNYDFDLHNNKKIINSMYNCYIDLKKNAG